MSCVRDCLGPEILHRIRHQARGSISDGFHCFEGSGIARFCRFCQPTCTRPLPSALVTKASSHRGGETKKPDPCGGASSADRDGRGCQPNTLRPPYAWDPAHSSAMTFCSDRPLTCRSSRRACSSRRRTASRRSSFPSLAPVMAALRTSIVLS
jgi:hypothetical protein